MIFNTPFEVSLRVLLLLSVIGKKAISKEKISALDFISINAKEFGIAENSLNGCTGYNLSGMSANLSIIEKALKRLVLERFIAFSRNDKELLYSITQIGQNYASRLSSEYAFSYLSSATIVIETHGDKNERDLFDLITSRAIKMWSDNK